MSAEDNIRVVTDFVAAWSRLDPEELAGFFTDDICYHNMPMAPVTGIDQVTAMIGAFIGDWSATTWDLLNVAASGDVVFTERLDRITAGDRGVDLPVAGVFELEGGKIRVWRDYFDLATFTGGMSGG
jgi:limonene-1,2-epoxide hydrolase